MATTKTKLRFLTGLFLLLNTSGAFAQESSSSENLEEIIITANRFSTLHGDLIGNTDSINHDIIGQVNPKHLNEVLSFSAGTWLSRGNGQESLLSVRSPVLTGAGSCAEFLTLQDGIALRASGFCNVNQLFDSHFEQASKIEVVKGVHGAKYGSNAIHGAVNIDSLDYTLDNRLSVQVGENSYQQLKANYNPDNNDASQYGIALTLSHDGGFQESSGYDQQKLSAGHLFELGDWRVDNRFTLSHLDQETAGFLQEGENAYRDSALLKINSFPEAYRNAFSARLMSNVSTNISVADTKHYIAITPYLRSNDMDFLMHFLPGQPIEENGHDSIGVQLQHQVHQLTSNDRLTVSSGIDIDFTTGYLTQTQQNPTDSGSAFLRAVLPQGKQYDYDVDSRNLAIYSGAEWHWSKQVSSNFSARYDDVYYDYDNNMLTGNTRDDGTECSFGGCRYTRPESRSDEFADWSLSFGNLVKLNNQSSVYFKLDKGFRAPHTSELYRLQNGQLLADIKGVTAKQAELGYRFIGQNWFIESNIYHLEKTDGIYQNSDREYLNGLDTQHQGAELTAKLQLNNKFAWHFNASWARHEYQSNPIDAQGNATPIQGNEIDTAPNWLVNSSLNWQANEKLNVNVQWIYVDNYFLEPENNERYEGHDLTHLRMFYQISPKWSASLRVNNVFDQRYAERADFAFGNHRYFVGLPRNSSLELRYRY